MPDFENLADVQEGQYVSARQTNQNTSALRKTTSITLGGASAKIRTGGFTGTRSKKAVELTYVRVTDTVLPRSSPSYVKPTADNAIYQAFDPNKTPYPDFGDDALGSGIILDTFGTPIVKDEHILVYYNERMGMWLPSWLPAVAVISVTGAHSGSTTTFDGTIQWLDDATDTTSVDPVWTDGDDVLVIDLNGAKLEADKNYDCFLVGERAGTPYYCTGGGGAGSMFVCVPTSGIPAASGGHPGVGTCEVWGKDPSSGAMVDAGFTIEVNSLYTMAIPSSGWVTAIQDQQGDYHVPLLGFDLGACPS